MIQLSGSRIRSRLRSLGISGGVPADAEEPAIGGHAPDELPDDRQEQEAGERHQGDGDEVGDVPTDQSAFQVSGSHEPRVRRGLPQISRYRIRRRHGLQCGQASLTNIVPQRPVPLEPRYLVADIPVPE
jgi:hypothetical protein